MLMEDAGLSIRKVSRRRSAAEKRWIVEQTLVPGASVARVAQADGVGVLGTIGGKLLISGETQVSGRALGARQKMRRVGM